MFGLTFKLRQNIWKLQFQRSRWGDCTFSGTQFNLWEKWSFTTVRTCLIPSNTKFDWHSFIWARKKHDQFLHWGPVWMPDFSWQELVSTSNNSSQWSSCKLLQWPGSSLSQPLPTGWLIRPKPVKLSNIFMHESCVENILILSYFAIQCLQWKCCKKSLTVAELASAWHKQQKNNFLKDKIEFTHKASTSALHQYNCNSLPVYELELSRIGCLWTALMLLNYTIPETAVTSKKNKRKKRNFSHL